MAGFGDSLHQSDQVTMSLNCAFCGQPAVEGHTCKEKEDAEKAQQQTNQESNE